MEEHKLVSGEYFRKYQSLSKIFSRSKTHCDRVAISECGSLAKNQWQDSQPKIQYIGSYLALRLKDVLP